MKLSNSLKVLTCFAILSVFFLSGCSSPVLKMKESLEELQFNVKNDPNNEAAHYNLGLGYLSKNKYPEAIAAFKDALKLNEHFSEAHFAIYCAEIAADKELKIQMLSDSPSDEYKAKIDSLKTSFDMAIMSYPFFEWKLAYLLLPSKIYSDDSYEQRILNKLYSIFYDGYEGFFIGDYDYAIAKFNYALTVIPNYQEAKYFRGLSFAINKNYFLAIQDFKEIADSIEVTNREKLLPIYINPANIHFLLGCAYREMNDLMRAERSFKRTLAEDFSFYMAHYHLSNIYSKQHRYKEALDELDAALMLVPNNQIMHYNKGCYLFDLQKYDEALIEFEKTVQINPKYYRARYNAALIYEIQKNCQKAIENYQVFIDNAPLHKSAAIAEAKLKIESLKTIQ